jgi:hypothetical protein
MSTYTEIKKCRICGSEDIESVFSLGNQYLTGVFPKSAEQPVTSGPVDLTWCSHCSLVQLKQSYSLGEMYGDNYGYRSGLNAYMVRHLTSKVKKLESYRPLQNNSIVVDIGSNDATTLKAYQSPVRRVGIDPTGSKFRSFYPDDITLVADFFSASKFFEVFPGERASLVTSIAMFYDLESPANFVRDVKSILSPHGLWHFEQSYLPAMLRTDSYDTICHEHLEFYSLAVVKDLLENNGMKIIDVETNSINGGSFAITACNMEADYPVNEAVIDWLLNEEKELGLKTLAPYQSFATRAVAHRNRLLSLLRGLKKSGKRVFGYGASTKGNVMLQYCGITPDLLTCIAEVNEEKFGCFTPGTAIPIISEREAKALKPDYFFVLPWHFRHNILEREREFMEAGGKFIFPLPHLEIV